MSVLVAAQVGHGESSPASFPGDAARADEGLPSAGLCCAEHGYEGPRSKEIRELIRECLEAEEDAE